MKNLKIEIPAWGNKKKYTFHEIKEFYNKIALFPAEILEQIKFYGGTIAYIMAQVESTDREFGDVDLLVPADKMSLLRKYFENIDSFLIQLDGKKIAEDYNIVATDGIQDFGFKGSLFGVRLSVHPISKTKEGLIVSKWVKINNGKLDLVADVVMLENTDLSEMFSKVDCGIGTLNVVRPELTIAWKKRRMALHDQQDIKFMYENEEIFGVKEENINMFSSRMPSYDVNKAYRITSSGVKELDKGKYEEF